jgi:hypothetical protein
MTLVWPPISTLHFPGHRDGLRDNQNTIRCFCWNYEEKRLSLVEIQERVRLGLPGLHFPKKNSVEMDAKTSRRAPRST